MTEGFGNTNQQAEKNASLNGLTWLKINKQEEIEKLLQNSQFNQSLKACFMQFDNLKKYQKPQPNVAEMMEIDDPS